MIELLSAIYGSRKNASCGEMIAVAQLIWKDAVAQVAGLRTKAETSAALVKQFGSHGPVTHGQRIYTDAKAEADTIIAGLIVALSAKGKPERLSSLQERAEHIVIGLAQLRNMAETQLPKLESMKDLSDTLKAATKQSPKPLLDAVTALYSNNRADNELTRKTIQTQLEAARWPDFDQVQAA